MYKSLLNWYYTVARPLPWRVINGLQDPYKVWVSEVMLQQTRAEAVIPYYLRFLEALPSVQALADAPMDTLYKLWEGLGYYSRVRNLQKAAKIICEQSNSTIPADFDALKKLPGIGDYTAGAIASIAFGIPVPAVDGNVLRVWARLTGDARDILNPRTRADIREKVAREIPPHAAGDFNQALMELGATLCGPNTAPNCSACPWNSYCVGFRDGTAPLLPNRAPKQERRVENHTLFILRHGSLTGLIRRPAKGVLAGQWAIPSVQEVLSESQVFPAVEALGLSPVTLFPLPPSKHIFTHIEWHMTAWLVEVAEPLETGEIHWFSPQDVENSAIPSAYRAYRSLLG